MDKVKIIQGREITATDIAFIKQLLADHPSWHRTRLSRELCKTWQWCRPDGRPKDMACRSLLLKLERASYITLPPRQARSMNGFRKESTASVPHETEEIRCSLDTLVPLTITPVSPQSDAHPLFNSPCT